MKLDKISIFGIALAVALIFFQMKFGAKNKQEIAAREAAAAEQVAGTTTSAVEETKALSTVDLPEGFTDEEVTLTNDSAIFKFSTATGALSRVTLPEQHEVNQLDVPVSLNRFGLKSIGGLETKSGQVIDAGYKASAVTDNSITFIGKLANGIVAKKEWKLHDSSEKGGDYRLAYTLTLENPTENVIEASNMNLHVGGATPLHKGEMPDQSGYFYLTGDGYKKKKSNQGKVLFFGSEFQQTQQSADMIKFIGVGNQFFTTFVTPKTPYAAQFTATPRTIELPEVVGGGTKKEATVSLSLPSDLINKNGITKFEYEVYAGPKRFQTLKQLKPNAGLVMNYGFFKPISGILNNFLTFFHNRVFTKLNGGLAWGLSIICLTLLIRTIMWPLTRISIKSSKRMAKLQPKIKELKDKYPEDPQKVQQEQMKLFSEYGINPVAGCLPMLAQIPIFFGLFTMLKSAVEFRHEKFLWINDLAEPDTIFTIPLFGFELPINILPILMFVTMAIQMSMNPAPTDPMQKMIMRFMPVMMVIFCYNFAAALALYWTTSNIFTIFQTWIMKVLPEPELKKREGAAKKGGFMEKLQKQAEEMQRLKAQQQAGNSGQMRDAKPKKKRSPKTGG